MCRQAAHGETLPFPMNHWVPWRTRKAMAEQFRAHSDKQVNQLRRHHSMLTCSIRGLFAVVTALQCQHMPEITSGLSVESWTFLNAQTYEGAAQAYASLAKQIEKRSRCASCSGCHSDLVVLMLTPVHVSIARDYCVTTALCNTPTATCTTAWLMAGCVFVILIALVGLLQRWQSEVLLWRQAQQRGRCAIPAFAVPPPLARRRAGAAQAGGQPSDRQLAVPTRDFGRDFCQFISWLFGPDWGKHVNGALRLMFSCVPPPAASTPGPGYVHRLGGGGDAHDGAAAAAARPWRLGAPSRC